MTESLKLSPSKPTRVAMARAWRKKAQKWLSDHDWQIVGALWCIALALGYLGFATYSARHNQSHSIWDNFYLTMQLFTMESGSVQGIDNWSLGVARFLAPVAALYTAITALALVFREQLQMLRVRFISNHVVICGLGRRGLTLATRFLDRGDQVVVIERDQTNERIAQCLDSGAIVILGNASDPEILLKAGVDRAEHLISVCGEDGINAEVAVDAREISSRRKRGPLKCVVQIDDFELCRLLKGQELGMVAANVFRLEFFNSFQRGARALMEDHPPFDDAMDKVPHILVVGVGRMGESLVTNIARAWRRMHPDSHERFRVTLIDRRAREKCQLLILKNPLLETACDLTPREMDVRSSAFLEGRFLFDSSEKCDVTRAYVLLDNDSRALSAAMVLLKNLRGYAVPIIVRLAHEGGLGTLLHGADETREGFGSLYAFGLLEKTCTPDLVLHGTHEALSQAIHQEYLDRQASSEKTQSRESRLVSWKNTPEEARDYFRRQADQIGVMLKKVGCTIEPLAHLDAHVFEFGEHEVESLARSIHDFHIVDVGRRSPAFAVGFDGIAVDSNPTPVAWEHRSEKTKNLYRAVVRRLPEFLAKVDFQIYRLK